DNLDTVISIKRQSEVCFRVSFEKSRNLAPHEAKPFDVTLATDPIEKDSIILQTNDVDKNSNNLAMALIIEGKKRQKEIAKCTGITQGRVSQLKKEAKSQNYIDKNGKSTAKGRKLLDKANLKEL
ncbi:MAG: hypothetical protein SVS15_08835, partial [Thermodesulfobacteriota bacterium]|nr:hypothetical protein [Thermodesulfobacteriota bacterium]